MQKPDIRKIAAKEVAIIASCIATAFGIGRFGALIPGIGEQFFSAKLAAMVYVASLAFRVARIFIRMTLAVALMLGVIVVALLFLSARYPAIFAFLK